MAERPWYRAYMRVPQSQRDQKIAEMKRLIEAEEKQLALLEHHFALIDRNAAVIAEECRMEQLAQEVGFVVPRAAVFAFVRFTVVGCPCRDPVMASAESRRIVHGAVRYKGEDDSTVLEAVTTEVGGCRRSKQKQKEEKRREEEKVASR